MQNAIDYILTLISTEIVEPFRLALINSSFVNGTTDLINRFLSAIFNLFRGNPTDKFDTLLTSESIALIIGTIFFILFLVLVFKIFSFTFSTCSYLMKKMLVVNENPKGARAWRRQWRAKK